MPCAQVQGYPVSRSVLAQKLRIIGPGLDLLSALVMIPAALNPVVFGDALPSECRHGAAYDLRLCQHGIARKPALAGQDRDILRQVAYYGAGFAPRSLQPTFDAPPTTRPLHSPTQAPPPTGTAYASCT